MKSIFLAQSLLQIFYWVNFIIIKVLLEARLGFRNYWCLFFLKGSVLRNLRMTLGKILWKLATTPSTIINWTFISFICLLFSTLLRHISWRNFTVLLQVTTWCTWCYISWRLIFLICFLTNVIEWQTHLLQQTLQSLSIYILISCWHFFKTIAIGLLIFLIFRFFLVSLYLVYLR